MTPFPSPGALRPRCSPSRLHLGSVVIGLALLAACNQDPTSRALRLSLPMEPVILDPSKASDLMSGYIIGNLFEGLTRYNQDLEIEGGVAESWEFTPDYSQITYHLRAGTRWADGQPVVSGDFLYAWQRLLDPNTAGDYAYFLYDIRNAEAVNSGEMPLDALGVEAPDDLTLVVHLSRPAAYFPHITAHTSTMPLRRDVIEQFGDRWTDPETFMGNGPFELTEWRHEYRLMLTANPDYYRRPPAIDRVEVYTISSKSTALALYDSGELDVVLDILPMAIPHYRGRPDFHNRGRLEVRYMGFRLDMEPFDDVRVRQAVCMSLTREEFPNVLRGGELTSETWLPDGILAHDPQLGLANDSERARQLLADAGFPGGQGFPEIVLLFRTGDDWRLVAENIQAQLQRELGISVQIENREPSAFFEAIDSDPTPFHLSRWVADFPDPENFMSLFISSSGNNNLAFASPRYDELVNQGVLAPTSAERETMYDQAQHILLEEETAMCPLYVGAQNQLVRAEVRGLEFNPLDVIDLEELTWAE